MLSPVFYELLLIIVTGHRDHRGMLAMPSANRISECACPTDQGVVSPRRIYACQKQSKAQAHRCRPEDQRDFQDCEINSKDLSLIL
jgi:hypothetical protein